MQRTTVLVLLAGGKSSRMGMPKGLLVYNDTYWLLEQINRFKSIFKSRVYIGLGYDYQLYFKAIPWLEKANNDFCEYNGVEVKVVLNMKPEYGAFSTLQTVLKKVNPKYSILVQPIDVPLLNSKELQQLIDTDNHIVIPKTIKKGHPVKLSPMVWKTLCNVNVLSKEARLDVQIKKFKHKTVTLVNMIDHSVNQNINTKKEWVEYKKSTTKK